MEVLSKARESMDARVVFGEPVVRDGLTVIPAARITGGGGGGTGQSGKGSGKGSDKGSAEGGESTGEGGGFGLRSTPAGAFVIKDGDVTWRPAMDINRVILGGQIVGIVALLVLRSIVRTLARRRAAAADDE